MTKEEYLGITIDHSRDARLSDQAQELLAKYYLRKGEKFQHGYARASVAWSTFKGETDYALAQRLYDYVSKGWFGFASPVLSNAPLPGEKARGLPISCVVGDTWVNTRSGGAKYARDIVVGDEVLTHKGRYRKVTNVMVTKNRDNIFRLKVSGRMTDLHITENHLVLTNLGWVRVDQLDVNRHLVAINREIESDERPYTIDMTEFCPYDFKLIDGKIHKKGSDKVPPDRAVETVSYYSKPVAEVNVDEGVAWALGLWFAEGNVSRNKDGGPTGIRITLNASGEQHLASRWSEIMSKAFNIETKHHLGGTVRNNARHSWLTIDAHSVVLGRFFSAFGNGCKEKILPDWLIDLPKNALSSFLDGILAGDGSIHRDGTVKITLANPRLIMQLYQIGLKLGRTMSLQMQAKAGALSTTRHVYTLVFRPEKISTARHSGASGMPFYDGLTYAPIKKIEKTNLVEDVYDFTVEEDHSFSVAGVVVHNCFAGYVPDTLEGLIDHTSEFRWLSVMGGGVGGHWADVRSVSEIAPGPIPFLRTIDADAMAYKQGKCYTPDTEVLTSRGWVRFDKLADDDLVGHVTDTVGLYFAKPKALVIEDHVGSMISVKTKNGAVDLMVTPDHSMVVEDKNRVVGQGKRWTGRLRKIRAENLPRHADVAFHTAVTKTDGAKTSLTWEDRFRIAFQADGHNYVSGSGCYFHFSKKRKIERMREILHHCGYSHTESVVKDGTTNFYIHAPVRGRKDFSWIDLADVSSQWCDEFVEELSHWYSSVKKSGAFMYTTTSREEADFVQAICALANKTTRLTTYTNREGNRADIHEIYVRDAKRLTLQKVDKEAVPYEGKVYCATVETGMLLVRRNGVVTVCGNTRKGSYAAYLDVSHPDIMEFIHLRVPTGDANRKCLGTGFHNAVNISDKFMQAVIDDGHWDLIDPASGEVRETVEARYLWETILEIRARTGEPYLMFSDTANRHLPEAQKALGLKINGSNLCSEIFLSTGIDHFNKLRTFVCCLSSLNVEMYDEWKAESETFVGDLITMLDNVIEYFIEHAPDTIEPARYSAMMERALGLGTMGLHALLQKNGYAFGSAEAIALDGEVHRVIKEAALKQTYILGAQRGESPDMKGTGRRNSHLLAIAPTANNASITGTSPGIEPWKANAFAHRTRVGTHLIKNRHLEAVLEGYGRNDDDTWQDIMLKNGSVQHLDFLTEHEKKVFRTAIEIDQTSLIYHAAERQKHICQGQSLNLFFPPNVARGYVNKVHILAWKLGLKSLYYYRTEARSRPDAVSIKIDRQALKDGNQIQQAFASAKHDIADEDDGDCVACQG